jgi:AcrR family transcriptional regulator
LSTQPKYATQGATHRRTESAILEGAKKLISQFGLSNISMIEIADASQVSRATLYNHYRDKSAVISALITAEEAAKEILSGLQAGEFDIHFPKRFSGFLKFLRILPYPLYFWVVRRFVKI